ncbi:XRE family transcriptional regulator [Streptococcus uberis]|uniref:XRE family transcriptional regulator n=1 Tax=Streptococcus uberis TaxID=1349 RepID=UPI0012B5E109|nr:XRE family transcriptional regulator [Streptococcus uberis]MTB43327.1 XRE family transcriptional regulator [Streptococcus uberis]
MVNKRKLRAVIVEKNTTQELLANELNIDRSTFSRKMSVNGKFTVEEANEIVKSLGLTKDEALAIFFEDTFA